MQNVFYFCWLAVIATGGFVYLWPVTLLILALFVACFVAARRMKKLPRAESAWIILVLVPLAMLSWGTIFRNAGDLGTRQLSWQVHGLWLMMFLMLPASALVTWRSRRQGWYVAGAASLIVGYYAFWAMYVSILSVTGNWS